MYNKLIEFIITIFKSYNQDDFLLCNIIKNSH